MEELDPLAAPGEASREIGGPEPCVYAGTPSTGSRRFLPGTLN